MGWLLCQWIPFEGYSANPTSVYFNLQLKKVRNGSLGHWFWNGRGTYLSWISGMAILKNISHCYASKNSPSFFKSKHLKIGQMRMKKPPFDQIMNNDLHFQPGLRKISFRFPGCKKTIGDKAFKSLVKNYQPKAKYSLKRKRIIHMHSIKYTCYTYQYYFGIN